MWIAGPVRSGALIPKVPTGIFRTKAARFINWSIGDDGKPFGLDFVREVPCSEWHLVMLRRGDIRLAKPAEISAAKGDVAPPKKKDK